MPGWMVVCGVFWFLTEECITRCAEGILIAGPFLVPKRPSRHGSQPCRCEDRPHPVAAEGEWLSDGENNSAHSATVSGVKLFHRRLRDLGHSLRSWTFRMVWSADLWSTRSARPRLG